MNVVAYNSYISYLANSNSKIYQCEVSPLLYNDIMHTDGLTKANYIK